MFFVMKGKSSSNPLLDQRTTDDVRQARTSHGRVEVPDREGDVAVVVHAPTKHQYETFYDGRNGWGRGNAKAISQAIDRMFSKSPPGELAQ
jgi:hypothetical protein